MACSLGMLAILAAVALGVTAVVPATTVLANATVSASSSLVITTIPSSEVDLQWNIGSVTGTSPTLTWAIQPVDPSNTNTVITGATSATSAALNAAGTGQLVLTGLQSAAVKVSWTVTGTTPSFNNVYATLSIKNPLHTATGGAW
jgi:hypothetical protein